MLSFRQPRSRDDLALYERSSVGGQATPRSGGHSKHPFANPTPRPWLIWAID